MSRIWRRSAFAVAIWTVLICSGVAVAQPNSSLWLDADYLIWWTDASDVPALVTTSPQGTPRTSAGVLGQPGTDVLFGGSMNDGARSGLKLNLGLWLDTQQCQAIEFNYLTLETLSSTYQRGSNGNPIVARPFTDAVSGNQVAELAAFTGAINGGLTASATSQGLDGWGINFRQRLWCCSECGRSERLDFLVGYRGLHLEDRVAIVEDLSSPFFAAGTRLLVQDEFDTTNSFHGINLGLHLRRQYCRWGIDAIGNVALGVNMARVTIDGSTTVTPPTGAVIQQQGGLLALASNMGARDHDDFSAVFDLGGRVSYQVNSALAVRLGYSFLFWPDVYRAGKQIDPVINTNLLPPIRTPVGQPVRPRRLSRQSDFWAHGLNLGLTYRY